ncbi:MAG: CofH family radical SAM protein [Bacteroidales bacterium]
MRDSGIDLKEALTLYSEPNLNLLSHRATQIRERINGKKLFYNRNFHLEPSNICLLECKFCSYRRGSALEPGAWSMSLPEIESYIKEHYYKGITEIHIVGSHHPTHPLSYYLNLIELVRKNLPKEVTIKAFSAAEIDHMCKISNLSPHRLISLLKELGVAALPGGGAEIFNSQIREKICPDKVTAQRWLEIHETAHTLGIRSNATMLFGHIESREHRVEHLLQLRQLQERSGGFDAFIPLHYKSKNNRLGRVGEVDNIEILRTFALSRVVLDNVEHIKSYWPSLGRELATLTLLYGADDFDGTIGNSTKIYSMAGSIEKSPNLTVEEIEEIAQSAGYIAVERDSLYNEIAK